MSLTNNFQWCSLFVVVFATAAMVTQAPAQERASAAVAPSGATKPASSAGLLNDWLREQSPALTNWDIGGQFRARLEHREDYAIPGYPNAVEFRRDNPDNTYLLLREKIHVGYTPAPWLTVLGEARDSSSHDDKRNPNLEADTFDLHQAYVLLGNAQELPLVAKVGRQELIYGDERVIGAFDWNNLGRVFDAAKVSYDMADLRIDVFSGRVVLPNDEHFNKPNDYDWFSGIYASTRWLANHMLDAYFLSRNVSDSSLNEVTTSSPLGGASPRDIYTLGLRIKSAPGFFAVWDYGAELAGQLGNFAGSADAPRQDHQAFAASLMGGYTFTNLPGSPRLGAEYNFATGDSDPSDNEHDTFDNLFPTNHKFYGFMDFVSWQNIHDVRLTGSIKPLSKLVLTLDYHALWLAETDDFFYQVNGAPRRTGGYGINPQAGSYVGSEVDFVGTWNFTKWASAQAGYGHFFAGDYIEDTLFEEASDADFVYMQAVLSF